MVARTDRGNPRLLQPVAHALVDADEDTRKALERLTGEQLNRRPGSAASAAYHVKHAMGSLDRLFTYARGESLSAEQMAALAAEKTIHTARHVGQLMTTAKVVGMYT
jgi:hypothetical protein